MVASYEDFSPRRCAPGASASAFGWSRSTGPSLVLAHVDFNSRRRVSHYGVDVEALDRIVEPLLAPDPDVDVYVIDEIGKMECFSTLFVDAVRTLLEQQRLYGSGEKVRQPTSTEPVARPCHSILGDLNEAAGAAADEQRGDS
jgi:NTPase